MRSTYTIAHMEVSQSTFDEIREKLLAAGYDHAVDDRDNVLDMTHIGLIPPTPAPK